jgi:hypothetical protein
MRRNSNREQDGEWSRIRTNIVARRLEVALSVKAVAVQHKARIALGAEATVAA